MSSARPSGSRILPRVWVALLVSLLAGTVGAYSQPAKVRSRLFQPGPMAALASGELVVLEGKGGLVKVSPATGRLEILVEQFRPYLAMGVETGLPGARGEILVGMRLIPAGGLGFSRLVLYSEKGSELASWQLSSPGFLTGMASDPERGILYLADAKSSEILGLPLEDPSAPPALRVRLRGVGSVGGLAFDAAGSRLFVADPIKGNLFVIEGSSARGKRIGSRLGEPAALAIDQQTHRLYVADPAGRRLWVVDLESEELTPQLFSQAEELQSPVGLAATPDGTLWVSDSAANALFAVDRDGVIVRQIP
ncbi:MAG: SMP-30/gluconolactonase/LRE family protein [Acidobacteria bacterium]|nr:SMP-30/gluconolactonase/LRE family protein [Acidobacteriota bacterium]